MAELEGAAPPAAPLLPPRASEGLIASAVRRPIAVLMVVLAIGVFGAVSFRKLPVTLLPDVSYPTLTVRTEYEGAAPADIEKLVTRRLEETLAVISNLVSYRSISRAGVSDVILEFQWNTPMTFAAQDVREKVDQAMPRLPEGVKRPLILRYDPALDPVLRIALFAGEDQDLQRLRELAEEEVRRRLENLGGVAAVRARGGHEEEWTIELREDLLEMHGVTADEVRQRVATENANVAGGILRDGDRESLVRTLGEITQPEELARLVVARRGGRPVRIHELGAVVPGHRERDVITRIEGRESVEIEIFKEAEANVVQVCADVKARLFGPEWRKRLHDGVYTPAAPRAAGPAKPGDPPPLVESAGGFVADALLRRGVSTRVLSDQSVFIERSVDEVKEAAIEGALLAVLVLYAFLRRLGPTIIIGLAIPVSILATFGPLYMSGISLNVMSLGGLALGIGMLVDAAIVVLEVISRHRDAGAAPVAAAVAGTREVAAAVFSSVLTTVAVFLPIVFVEGIAGRFFRDQAVVVVLSQMASLFAAVFFIPTLSARSFRIPRQEGGLRGFLARHDPRALRDTAAGRNLSEAQARIRARRGGVLGILGNALLILFEVLVRAPVELAFRVILLVLAPLVTLIGLAALGLSRLARLLISPALWAFDHGYAAVHRTVLLMLRGALRARLPVVALCAALCTWAAVRLPRIGVELMPAVHEGEFIVENQLEVGTPVEATDAVSVAVTESARRALAHERLAAAGLSSSAGVDRNVIAKAGDGKHTSRVNVSLDATEDLAATEERAIRAIREELASLPETREPLFVRPTLFSTKMALEVEVVGEDLDALREAAAIVAEGMRRLPGLADVQSTWRPGHPELVIEPDREQLAVHDLTAGGVAALVRDKVQGAVSTRISKGDRKIDVVVRAPRAELTEKAALLALRVSPVADRPVPLSVVAAVEQQPGPAEIRRVRGERAIVLSAEVQNLDLANAARRIEGLVGTLRDGDPQAFRDISVRIAGQREESERSLDSLLFALAIAVFLVYIIMAAQFESLHHPLVILLTIPMALVGVVFALEALSIKISVVVLLGGILLVGIVVDNAIVLIDCVNQLRRSGLSRNEALVRAADLRLRPIAMTTLTTVLGLVPLALAKGEGKEIQTPMAITVIAGMASSSLLTLIVIPVVYSLVTRPGPIADAEEA